ncbi:hypothetical protein FQN60_005056, partial [Etheostoma spectabile]
TTEPTVIRTQVLTGLLIILGDNPIELFKAGFEYEDYFRDRDIGILLISVEVLCSQIPSISVQPR